jgi:peptide/nickel transport system ATP-binding protein
VTHDLSVVKHISTDILVMYVGTMVEKCGAKELFERPLHPYTKGLLSAIPVASIDYKRERIILQGELSSPINPGRECRFVNRCPYASDICRQESPTCEEVLPQHFVTCHHAREINNL